MSEGHSTMICIKSAWFRNILWGLETFCGVWRRFEDIWWWICDQARRLRAVGWSFGWNSDDSRRVGAILRQFGLIWVKCMVKWDDWRHCVAFQDDSGQFETSWRRFLVMWAKSGTIWGKWRHSVMSLGRFLMYWRRFVEVLGSSGPSVLILRRFNGIVVKLNRI